MLYVLCALCAPCRAGADQLDQPFAFDSNHVERVAIPVNGVTRSVASIAIDGETLWEPSSPLPYDAEIEYLESTGTQWIDTGILANTSVRPLMIRFQPLSGRTGYFFGGGDSASSGFGLRVVAADASVFTVGFGWTRQLQYWNRAYRAAPQAAGFVGVIFRVNGTGGNGLSFSGSYSVTFALFGRKVGETVERTRVRIYGAKIGALDLVPVRVNTTGYLYDRVSGQLFGNAGTGAFILGPDK